MIGIFEKAETLQSIDQKEGIDHVAIQFNKITGAFLGYVIGVPKDRLKTEYFKYRFLEMDTSKEEWSGDYDSGKIVGKHDLKPTILEDSLDNQAQSKIRTKYDYYKQINILMSIIDDLVQGQEISAEHKKDYAEMKEYIDETLRVNNSYKTAYSELDDFDYLDKTAQDKAIADQTEGGIHEIMGERALFQYKVK